MTSRTTGIPGLRVGRDSKSDGDTIETGLKEVFSFTANCSTAGAVVQKTSVSGGTVTISLKTGSSGATISADEDIDWKAFGRD